MDQYWCHDSGAIVQVVVNYQMTIFQLECFKTGSCGILHKCNLVLTTIILPKSESWQRWGAVPAAMILSWKSLVTWSPESSTLWKLAMTSIVRRCHRDSLGPPPHTCTSSLQVKIGQYTEEAMLRAISGNKLLRIIFVAD